MGIRLPICIALALAGTIQVSANVTDMRCEYRVDPIRDPIKSKHTLRICFFYNVRSEFFANFAYSEVTSSDNDQVINSETFRLAVWNRLQIMLKTR